MRLCSRPLRGADTPQERLRTHRLPTTSPPAAAAALVPTAAPSVGARGRRRGRLRGRGAFVNGGGGRLLDNFFHDG